MTNARNDEIDRQNEEAAIQADERRRQAEDQRIREQERREDERYRAQVREEERQRQTARTRDRPGPGISSAPSPAVAAVAAPKSLRLINTCATPKRFAWAYPHENEGRLVVAGWRTVQPEMSIVVPLADDLPASENFWTDIHVSRGTVSNAKNSGAYLVSQDNFAEKIDTGDLDKDGIVARSFRRIEWNGRPSISTYITGCNSEDHPPDATTLGRMLLDHVAAQPDTVVAPSLVQAFLDAGADVSLRGEDALLAYREPFRTKNLAEHLVAQDNLPALQVLASKGYDFPRFDATEDMMVTSEGLVLTAIRNGASPQLIEFLGVSGVHFNRKKPWGNPVRRILSHSPEPAWRGDEGVARLRPTIRYFPDGVDQLSDIDGLTLLHVYVIRNDLVVTRFLLSQGASTKIKSEKGDTAMDLARSDEMRALLTGRQASRP